jgi:PAS domain S-box-containing protein
MSQERNIMDENKRLKEERDLYARTLEETNLRFERKVKELSLLRSIGDVISCTFDLELFCCKLVEIIIEETNAENCSLMLKDPESNKLILKVAKGSKDKLSRYFEKLKDSNVVFSLGKGIAGKVALEGKPILINDVKNDKRFDHSKKTRPPIGSLLCCPFVSQQQVLGVINLSSSQSNAFSDDDMRVMSIFSAVATSIFTNTISYLELKESEEKFRAIFEGARDALLIIDPLSKKIIDCNKQTEDWLGYTKKELLRINQVLDLFSPEHKKEEILPFEEFIRKVIKENASEITLSGKDGNKRLGEIKVSDIRYQGRNLVQLAIRDIAERKEIEGELKETKDFLDNVIESSLDPIITTDTKGYITRVNKSFLNMLGYKKEETLGKHTTEFSPLKEGTYESTTGELVEINEEFFNSTRTWVSRLIEEGKISNVESYNIRKDNKVVPVEDNIVYLCNKEGERTGAVGIIRDITERKRVERKTREDKEFLENLFKTSADAILVTDPQGNITMLNDAMAKIVGYSRDELLGKHSSILAPLDKDIRAKIVSDHNKLFEEGAVYGYETVWRRKDGQHISIESNKSLLRNKDGQIIGGVNFTRDVTEKKRVESVMLQTEKLKSLGELAGGVAHDFNNVLAAILGRVQLLKMKIEPPSGKRESRKSVHDLKKGLEIIEKASLDGAETVRRIQEFSRRRADDKNFTQVDINELIDHALEFTRVRWKDDTESKGIKIKIIKEFSSLPSIAGSASELREVFTNFINNALDAMPQGGQVKIKTFKKGRNVFVKLEDTGVGIPKAIRGRIFDPFFTTKGPQSTGLGMSVSYGIINRHQGTIKIESVEGKGTTFTIKLPVISGETSEVKVKPLPRERKKARILVVEDEEGVRELLKDILTDGGYEVETASRGSEGIKMFKKKDFDLVFTDLGMPGMSGWQVAEETKKINRNTPVALITGWEVQMENSELKERGVDLVVNKPFHVEQVLKLVQEGMEIKSNYGTKGMIRSNLV